MRKDLVIVSWNVYEATVNANTKYYLSIIVKCYRVSLKEKETHI
jgi:hypothetical protein